MSASEDKRGGVLAAAVGGEFFEGAAFARDEGDRVTDVGDGGVSLGGEVAVRQKKLAEEGIEILQQALQGEGRRLGLKGEGTRARLKKEAAEKKLVVPVVVALILVERVVELILVEVMLQEEMEVIDPKEEERKTWCVVNDKAGEKKLQTALEMGKNKKFKKIFFYFLTESKRRRFDSSLTAVSEECDGGA
ncbi:hypothetical protein C2S52_016040 [Perilla frutescens var. hirtella]|nr:hypothetical protein C2S52_016040 [Perilla frutescens var. hirtella]